MRTLVIDPRPLDLKGFVKRSALDSDCPEVITESCKVLDSKGNVRILYLVFDNKVDTEALRKAVQTIEYATSERTGGLKTTSAIFGFAPRSTLRKDYCSTTAMATKFPKEHKVICDFAEVLSKAYQENIPEVFSEHLKITDVKVKKQWRIKDTPFTSGIVNKNNPLKYHFDSGNFKNVYSNMIVFKKSVQGGQLACPEYNITLDCADNSVVMFDGQNILHGVTPIHYQNKDAYRYSLVYYSLQQMWKCDTVDGEIARIRAKRVEREEKRATKK